MNTVPARNPSLDNICAAVTCAMTMHVGRARGAKASLLSSKTGLSERTLRLAISELRTRGYAIVGTPETGYYIAQTTDELQECCRFLRSRALHSLMLDARLRRLSLPTLLGQLQLELAVDEPHE